MNLYSCGTIVTITSLKIEGRIKSISIQFNKVSYEIGYFVESKQVLIWLDEVEFTTESKNKIKVGFKC